VVHASFPDLHFDIEDIVAKGNKVVYRYKYAAPTRMILWVSQRPVGKSASQAFTFQHGKLQEQRENWDALGLMRQLGVVPEPAQESEV
jgi:predicted ester cyclase